jgi:hypothetical protein
MNGGVQRRYSARNGRPRLSYSTAQRARPLLQPLKWANSTCRFQITPDETRESDHNDCSTRFLDLRLRAGAFSGGLLRRGK